MNYVNENDCKIEHGVVGTPSEEPIVAKLSCIHDNLSETMDTLIALHGKMFGSALENKETNTAISIEDALSADCRISRYVSDLAHEIKSRIGV